MKLNRLNPLFIILFLLSLSTYSFAEPAKDIDAKVDFAISQFKEEVTGGANFLPKVKGYLVFPSVVKGGFIVGAEYGEGALRINGETKHYYSMTSASIGYQAGVQVYSIVIAFVSEASLHSFIKSNGWEAGVDGSITVSDWGEGRDISSMSFEKPIIAFVYGQKGLMAGVSIKGTKFLKIIPQ